MLAEMNNVHINFESSEIKNPSLITLIFLHGFTGSSKDWKEIVNRLPCDIQTISIDLIGHGKSDSPDDVSLYSTDAITSQINSIIENLELEKIILVGYSMGGRVALSFVIRFPQRIKGLILESTSPGISDPEERKKRKENDESLCGLIEKDGINKFIGYWMNLPLFESQRIIPEEILKVIKSEKLNNNQTGLSNSLREFGQGVMPHLWDVLYKIKCNVLLISGELDKKYSQLNSLIKLKIQNVEHKIVAEAGHNVHLEKPEVFVSLLKDFIKKII